MGTQFTVYFDEQGHPVKGPKFAAPDQVQLAYLAILARPFTLEQEEIYYKKVSDSLLRFSTTEPQRTMSRQLKRLWTDGVGPRMYVHMARATDGGGS